MNIRSTVANTASSVWLRHSTLQSMFPGFAAHLFKDGCASLPARQHHPLRDTPSMPEAFKPSKSKINARGNCAVNR